MCLSLLLQPCVADSSSAPLHATLTTTHHVAVSSPVCAHAAPVSAIWYAVTLVCYPCQIYYMRLLRLGTQDML